MIKFDLIPTQAYWIAIVGLTVLLGVQQVRVSALKVDVAQAGTALQTEKTAREKETAARLRLAGEYKDGLLALQTEHADLQNAKEKTHAAQIKTLEADKLAGAATAGRLRQQLAAFASRDRPPGETDAAAIERYASRLGTVSGLLAESIDLVTESRDIIGRRDLEVANLLQQIQIDRKACTTPAGFSGEPKP